MVRAAAAHRALIGARLMAIGEQPVAAVQSRLNWLIPQGENEPYVLARSVELLREPEVLAALGIAPVFRFVDAAGPEMVAALGRRGAAAGRRAPPAVDATVGRAIWFSHLVEHDAVYVQFRSYGGLEANAIRLFEALRQRPARRLIIDLRRNGGGNFLAGRQWLLSPSS